MLYQMGVGSFAFFGFLAVLIVSARRLVLLTGRSDFWFAYITVTTVFANAVLQEEAFYSPLSLGFCLLLTGTALGAFLRETSGRPGNHPRPQAHTMAISPAARMSTSRGWRAASASACSPRPVARNRSR
jgi:hypothetical protein